MFTTNQIEEIRKKLQLSGIKDTAFPQAGPLKGNEIIALVQQGVNVKMPVKEFVDKAVSWLAADFANLYKIQDTSYTLEEAIQLIAPVNRNIGQTITFKNKEGIWDIYQFRGESYEDWEDITNWYSMKSDLQSIVENYLGKPNGIAPLDSNGLVPSEHLPSFVDDVIEGYYQSNTSFVDVNGIEITPEKGKIYVDLASTPTNSYRWSGSQYMLTSNPLTIGTTKGSAFDGASGLKNTNDIAALKSQVNNLGSVSFTPVYTSGTKIGTLTIGNETVDIYIPIWNGTLEQYNAITTKNANFIYNITD